MSLTADITLASTKWMISFMKKDIEDCILHVSALDSSPNSKWLTAYLTTLPNIFMLSNYLIKHGMDKATSTYSLAAKPSAANIHANFQTCLEFCNQILAAAETHVDKACIAKLFFELQWASICIFMVMPFESNTGSVQDAQDAMLQFTEIRHAAMRLRNPDPITATDLLCNWDPSKPSPVVTVASPAPPTKAAPERTGSYCRSTSSALTWGSTPLTPVPSPPSTPKRLRTDGM